IGGIMEHIEQAGVHSGDSACSLPPNNLAPRIQAEIRDQVKKLGLALKVVGLMNIQFAIQGGSVYILEVNPRASRTVPFVSKATGQLLAKIASRCMIGKGLAEQGALEEVQLDYYAAKEAVFPFIKLPGVDPILGPEMKSTGEVMGIGRTFAEAFAKSQQAAGVDLPADGRVFISVRDADKADAVAVARDLHQAGFKILATRGTARVLEQAEVPCQQVHKVGEGRPHIVDMIKNDEISLIVNTTEGKQAIADSYEIRRAALQRKVTYTTTLAGAKAMALVYKHPEVSQVYCLQELHKRTGP
ncbi:MAG TPA: carbamoyl phosphate synthase large subunit, partial [Gammaproteobacteria bacterium]|nr:carbamoyl phosphate synthase large subunit [Gammaproteobacteria bacterium]